MAYTHVIRSKSGAALISYLENEGRGHNGHEMRNACVSRVNMLWGVSATAQMNRQWRRARGNHTCQLIGIIQSFSKKELDPNNIGDVYIANRIGRMMVEEHYPGRQAVVFTQIDGVGGLIHNHIVVNDCDLAEAKGCDKEQYHKPQIEAWSDEIAGRFFELDHGDRSAPDKATRTEIAKREKGEYVFKDDIKSRVKAAMEACEKESDFEYQLAQQGIAMRHVKESKNGEHYVYELMDFSQMPGYLDAKTDDEREAVIASHVKNTKSRSYKLGADYGPEKLREICAGKVKQELVQNEATGKGLTKEIAAAQVTAISQNRKRLLPSVGEDWLAELAAAASDDDEYEIYR